LVTEEEDIFHKKISKNLSEIEEAIDERYDKFKESNQENFERFEKKEDVAIPNDDEIEHDNNEIEDDFDEEQFNREEVQTEEPPEVSKESEVEVNRVLKRKIGVKNIFSKDSDKAPKKSGSKIVGKPVFLQDTGEKLGFVDEIIYDENKKITGYKIKDIRSDTILEFSDEQFDADKRGLILIPSWYNKIIKTIEKLEFVDRTYPELKSFLVYDTFDDDVFDFVVNDDQDISGYIKECKKLRWILDRQISILEKKRLTLADKTMDLTKKRLIEDMNRKQYSDEIMKLRRETNIISENVERCKELLEKLNSTSIGMMCEKENTYFNKENVTNLHDYKKNRMPFDNKMIRDSSINKILAEIIEEKIVEDIKKELIKNNYLSFDNFDFQDYLRDKIDKKKK
jgi:hypothetical protein